MIFHGNVVVRRGKRYWVGTIKGIDFTEERKLDGLSELGGVKLLSLYDYSQIIGLDYSKKKLDDIRRQIGYSEILVIDDECPEPTSGGVSEAVWKKWYFKFIHIMCQKCVRGCKQSSRVSVFCNKFEEKK